MCPQHDRLDNLLAAVCDSPLCWNVCPQEQDWIGFLVYSLLPAPSPAGSPGHSAWHKCPRVFGEEREAGREEVAELQEPKDTEFMLNLR